MTISYENRLFARIASDLVRRFDLYFVDAKRKHKYRGRRLSKEGLIAAIVSGWLRLSEEERDALLRRELPEAERLLEEDEAKEKKPAPESEDPKEGEPIPGYQTGKLKKPKSPGRGKRDKPGTKHDSRPSA